MIEDEYGRSSWYDVPRCVCCGSILKEGKEQKDGVCTECMEGINE